MTVVPPSRSRPSTRVALGILTVMQATIGLWALLAPAHFFASFPGLGQVWVATLPPYNEHLTRDVGALSLGLTVVGAHAVISANRSASRVAALAYLVYTVPHAVFHAWHLDHLTTGGAVAQSAGFALQLVLAVVVLVTARRGVRVGLD